MKEQVRHGGLFRCCTSSLDAQRSVRDVPPAKEGDVVHCEHCKSSDGMIFRNGAWEWNHVPVKYDNPA